MRLELSLDLGEMLVDGADNGRVARVGQQAERVPDPERGLERSRVLTEAEQRFLHDRLAETAP